MHSKHPRNTVEKSFVHPLFYLGILGQRVYICMWHRPKSALKCKNSIWLHAASIPHHDFYFLLRLPVETLFNCSKSIFLFPHGMRQQKGGTHIAVDSLWCWRGILSTANCHLRKFHSLRTLSTFTIVVKVCEQKKKTNKKNTDLCRAAYCSSQKLRRGTLPFAQSGKWVGRTSLHECCVQIWTFPSVMFIQLQAQKGRHLHPAASACRDLQSNRFLKLNYCSNVSSSLLGFLKHIIDLCTV